MNTLSHPTWCDIYYHNIGSRNYLHTTIDQEYLVTLYILPNIYYHNTESINCLHTKMEKTQDLGKSYIQLA